MDEVATNFDDRKGVGSAEDTSDIDYLEDLFREERG